MLLDVGVFVPDPAFAGVVVGSVGVSDQISTNLVVDLGLRPEDTDKRSVCTGVTCFFPAACSASAIVICSASPPSNNNPAPFSPVESTEIKFPLKSLTILFNTCASYDGDGRTEFFLCLLRFVSDPGVTTPLSPMNDDAAPEWIEWERSALRSGVRSVLSPEERVCRLEGKQQGNIVLSIDCIVARVRQIRRVLVCRPSRAPVLSGSVRRRSSMKGALVASRVRFRLGG